MDGWTPAAQQTRVPMRPQRGPTLSERMTDRAKTEIEGFGVASGFHAMLVAPAQIGLQLARAFAAAEPATGHHLIDLLHCEYDAR